jgi:hypothetical protein
MCRIDEEICVLYKYSNNMLNVLFLGHLVLYTVVVRKSDVHYHLRY